MSKSDTDIVQSLANKLLNKEKTDLKEEIARLLVVTNKLEEHIKSFKILGTDACPDCDNNYPYYENRVAFYYNTNEHKYHKTEEETKQEELEFDKRHSKS